MPRRLRYRRGRRQMPWNHRLRHGRRRREMPRNDRFGHRRRRSQMPREDRLRHRRRRSHVPREDRLRHRRRRSHVPRHRRRRGRTRREMLQRDHHRRWGSQRAQGGRSGTSDGRRGHRPRVLRWNAEKIRVVDRFELQSLRLGVASEERIDVVLGGGRAGQGRGDARVLWAYLRCHRLRQRRGVGLEGPGPLGVPRFGGFSRGAAHPHDRVDPGVALPEGLGGL
jgi:hypothetical protein